MNQLGTPSETTTPQNGWLMLNLEYTATGVFRPSVMKKERQEQSDLLSLAADEVLRKAGL